MSGADPRPATGPAKGLVIAVEAGETDEVEAAVQGLRAPVADPV
ncbi:hypothetical protein AB0G71_07170 [Streptomyces sp. NPDC020403]